MIRTAILAIALLTLSAGPGHADETVARSLLVSQGCKGCHVFDGEGGNLGPSLDKVGKRLNAYQIEQKLLTPRKTNPGSVMPSFGHLTDEQLLALVNFLKNRK